MNGDKVETADIHEILRLLPHRYPFVMIDRKRDPHLAALAVANMTAHGDVVDDVIGGGSGGAATNDYLVDFGACLNGRNRAREF